MAEIYNLLTPVPDESRATHINPSNFRNFFLEEKVGTRNKFWYSVGRYNQRLDDELASSSKDSESGESGDELDQDLPKPFHLGEVIKHGENVPVQFTFSFTFPYVRGHRSFYQGGLVYQLLDLIRITLNRVFQTRERTLSACVFTRKPKKRDQQCIIELKIQYPYLRTDYRTMIDKVKPVLLEQINKVDLSSFFTLSLKNTWEEILQFDQMRSYLPIYGGDDSINPFRVQGNYLFKDGEYQSTSLDQVFDLTLHQDFQRQIFQPNNPHKVDLWEPLYYSKGYYDRITSVKNDEELKTHDQLFVINQAEGEKIIRTKEYLNMISRKRFNCLDYWKDIGKALHHTCKGEKQGRDLWIEATQHLSSKFSREDCEDYYERFNQKDHHITIKTLAWYARKDDPNQFQDYLEDRFSQKIAEGLGENGGEFEFTRALAVLLELDYVCVPKDSRSYRWYRFHQNHWEPLVDENKLLDFISVQYYRHLRACLDDLLNARGNADGNIDRDIIMSKIKELRRHMKGAKELPMKRRLLRHSTSALVRPQFEERLDSNWNILGVKNGLIKTKKDRAIFREAKPEDYVCRKSRTPYRKSYYWDHPKVKAVMTWFSELFPDPTERDFFIKVLSSVLCGGNTEKKGIFLISDTGGGKSKLAQFINIILEGYHGSLPEGELTSRREKDSSAANPFMAQNMNNNIVWIHELEGQVNDNVWKRWTGEDAGPNRNMYEAGSTTNRPRFTPFVISNFPPTFRNSDDSTIGRGLFFFLKSIWVDNPPKTREEQIKQRRFKIDRNFGKKLFGMAPAGLWVLVEYYRKYRREGIRDTPKGIQEALDEYWNKNDVIGVFIQDHIRYRNYQKSENPYATTDDIYDCYRYFLEKQFPGIVLQRKDRFVIVLRQRFEKKRWKPEYDGRGWKDISLLR